MGLENKVAIVTGAARGIGKAIARKLSQEGARIVICDLLEELFATAEELRLEGASVMPLHGTNSPGEAG